MGKLQDKIAVVTGAGRGIGKDIAMRFASEGAKVAVISRTEANSQSAADAINAMYPGAARAYRSMSRTRRRLANWGNKSSPTSIMWTSS